MDSSTMTLFSGTAHPALADEIAQHLGLPMGKIEVGVIGVLRGMSFARGADDLVGMQLAVLCDDRQTV